VKIVILCGGKGTRLAEETRVIPKPMVSIGGIPIVCHIINHFLKFGYTNFVLATGYLSEKFSSYFSEENSKKLRTDFNGSIPNITLYDTGLDTLTGGRILRLKELLSNEDEFILTYGDGLADLDVSSLERFHKSHSKLATVTAVRPPARFGVIKISDFGLVEYFQEKNQTDTGWINGGFFVFNQKIFEYLENDQTVLEDVPLRKLTSEGELMAFKHNNFWQCMDTLRDREFLEELWNSGAAPWK
jgi:glucose-1-phosphate cytidylyltransferase